jgi:hypothetical protein
MYVWGSRPVRIQVKIWNFALIFYNGALRVQLRESTVPYLTLLVLTNISANDGTVHVGT